MDLISKHARHRHRGRSMDNQRNKHGENTHSAQTQQEVTSIERCINHHRAHLPAHHKQPPQTNPHSSNQPKLVNNHSPQHRRAYRRNSDWQNRRGVIQHSARNTRQGKWEDNRQSLQQHEVRDTHAVFNQHPNPPGHRTRNQESRNNRNHRQHGGRRCNRGGMRQQPQLGNGGRQSHKARPRGQQHRNSADNRHGNNRHVGQHQGGKERLKLALPRRPVNQRRLLGRNDRQAHAATHLRHTTIPRRPRARGTRTPLPRSRPRGTLGACGALNTSRCRLSAPVNMSTARRLLRVHQTTMPRVTAAQAEACRGTEKGHYPQNGDEHLNGCRLL